MAKVLLVDSNPDHRKSLKGLFAYRMTHTVVMVNDCVAGARACVSERPDLIMINLLQFLDNKFAFSKVVGRMQQIGKIPILVHTTGAVEDLTRRRVEVNGAAAIVELPCSGDELGEEINRAIDVSKVREASSEVKPVSWPKAKVAGAKTGKRDVKSVDWGAVASQSGSNSRKAVAANRPGPSPKRVKTPSPVANGNGNAFRPAAFDSVDPNAVKGSTGPAKPEAFKKTVWPSAEPENPKKKGGRKS